MKKFIIFALAIVFGSFTASAQLGGLVEKAAKKAAKKTEEKITEKAAEKASEAIVNQLPETESDDKPEMEEEVLTYESLMRKMPELPTTQQIVDHKKAVLNEQNLKMLTSKVTKFQMTVLDLTTKAFTIQYQNADSAQIVEAAYKNAELYTGLSKEEIDMLATMSDEEQEAYLQAHYREGQAEAALLQQAADASVYLEPLQPIIDRWTEVGNKVEKIYADATARCEEIYGKYADRLAKSNDKERNKILLNYYEEAVPVMREAVKNGSRIRFEEQLPIAMEIEEEMIPIRAEHQDVISALLNYPQLTASQYFTEALQIIELPEFPDYEE